MHASLVGAARRDSMAPGVGSRGRSGQCCGFAHI